MTTKQTILVLGAFILAFGLLGEGDYQDAVAADAEYCDNVRNGVWPNYKNLEC